MIFWSSSFFLSVVSGCENFWSTTWNNPTALWQKIQNKHPLSLAGLRTSAATGKALTSLQKPLLNIHGYKSFPWFLCGRGLCPTPAEFSTHHGGLVASAHRRPGKVCYVGNICWRLPTTCLSTVQASRDTAVSYTAQNIIWLMWERNYKQVECWMLPLSKKNTR